MKAVLAFGLALAVLAVSILFFSPLHKHDRASMRTCGFTQFEHGGSFEPPAVVSIAAPSAYVCQGVAPDSPSCRVHIDLPLIGERSPPALAA